MDGKMDEQQFGVNLICPQNADHCLGIVLAKLIELMPGKAIECAYQIFIYLLKFYEVYSHKNRLYGDDHNAYIKQIENVNGKENGTGPIEGQIK